MLRRLEACRPLALQAPFVLPVEGLAHRYVSALQELGTLNSSFHTLPPSYHKEKAREQYNAAVDKVEALEKKFQVCHYLHHSLSSSHCHRSRCAGNAFTTSTRRLL